MTTSRQRDRSLVHDVHVHRIERLRVDCLGDLDHTDASLQRFVLETELALAAVALTFAKVEFLGWSRNEEHGLLAPR